MPQPPPLVERPKVDWFDPEKPAKADPKADWLVEIYEARFVGVKYTTKDEPTIFGDLRETGKRFVAWFPTHGGNRFARSVVAQLMKERLRSGVRLVDFVREWENPAPWSKDLRRLGYTHEQHDADNDPLRLAADITALSPLFKTTINVTLAIRKALRRYLGIEAAPSQHDVREATRSLPRADK